MACHLQLGSRHIPPPHCFSDCPHFIAEQVEAVGGVEGPHPEASVGRMPPLSHHPSVFCPRSATATPSSPQQSPLHAGISMDVMPAPGPYRRDSLGGSGVVRHKVSNREARMASGMDPVGFRGAVPGGPCHGWCLFRPQAVSPPVHQGGGPRDCPGESLRRVPSPHPQECRAEEGR